MTIYILDVPDLCISEYTEEEFLNEILEDGFDASYSVCSSTHQGLFEKYREHFKDEESIDLQGWQFKEILNMVFELGQASKE